MNSKHGFTLAEILITLTVIGVVAALTIPTLLQNTNQAELKAGLKREFADLQQATISIKNDNGGSLVNAFLGDALGTESLKNAFKAKLSYIKECSGSNSFGGSGLGGSAEECWHAANTWYQLNGLKRNGTDQPSLILNNGTLINFIIQKSDCTSSSTGNYKRCGNIVFDVNGFKAPNTIGKDVFGADLTDDGIIPFGARGSYDINDPSVGCLPTASGWGCAAKYLYE